MNYVVAALASILASESVFHLPFARVASASVATARKSVAVIQSSRISDHWKSRALLHYALLLGVAALKLTLMCGAMLGIVASVGLAGCLFRQDMFHFLMAWPGLGTMTVVSVLYFVGRRRST